MTINELQQMKEDLLNKKIKPKDVVGTGYKNPRKIALEWLEKRIKEVEYENL